MYDFFIFGLYIFINHGYPVEYQLLTFTDSYIKQAIVEIFIGESHL